MDLYHGSDKTERWCYFVLVGVQKSYYLDGYKQHVTFFAIYLRNQLVTCILVTEQLHIRMRRDVFQAIADPVRRKIIDILSSESLTVNEIAEQFDISRPAISKQIKILNECGLVSISQNGRERYCMINATSLIPAFMWIEQHKKLWEERLDSLEDYINQLKTKQKEDGKKG